MRGGPLCRVGLRFHIFERSCKHSETRTRSIMRNSTRRVHAVLRLTRRSVTPAIATSWRGLMQQVRWSDRFTREFTRIARGIVSMRDLWPVEGFYFLPIFYGYLRDRKGEFVFFSAAMTSNASMIFNLCWRNLWLICRTCLWIWITKNIPRLSVSLTCTIFAICTKQCPFAGRKSTMLEICERKQREYTSVSFKCPIWTAN